MSRSAVDTSKRFTPLSEQGLFSSLSSEGQRILSVATHNRVVLIHEISEFVLQHRLGLKHEDYLIAKRIRHATREVALSEENIDYKFFEFPHYQEDNETLLESILRHKPVGWTWAEYHSAGGAISFWTLSLIFDELFKETEHIARLAKSGRKLYHFKARCEASGLPYTLPINYDQSFTDRKSVHRRSDYIKPRDRIKRLKTDAEFVSSQAPNNDTPWQYTGILQNEARIRLEMAAISHSWTSTRSAWNAWAEMCDIIDPQRAHFPISVNKLAIFSMSFDNPDSMNKYLQHLRKACVVFRQQFISKDDERAIKAGASKAKPEKKRSFIMADDTQKYSKYLLEMKRDDLARVGAVSYSFQLRVQSELIILQAHAITDEEAISNTAWWSYAIIEKLETTIVFRRRKNKNYVSRVSRKCTCRITPYACGKCALDKQVTIAREKGEERVFWTVGNIDIRVFQSIAAKHGMPYPTWHGFRRGKTSDLVAGYYRGENISLEDIFESGGWLSGSRAILHYLKREFTDCGNIVKTVCCLSDTD